MKNTISNIEIQNINNVLLVSSQVVANNLHKRHSDVCTKIEEVLEVCENFRTPPIEAIKNVVINPQNKQEYKEYLLTKDGFILLVMNYTGYNDFKRAYIKKFNQMEQQLNKSLYNKIENLHTLNFPLPIFSLNHLRYQFLDNIPYFVYTDIFEALDIKNYHELLHKLSIILKPLYLTEEDRKNNNIFSLALNLGQILEIIHHINNTRCILFEKFLLTDENLATLSYRNLESYLI